MFDRSNNLITWASQKQRTVVFTSCEAEYMAATEGARHALWLRNLLNEINGDDQQKIKLMINNKGAIALT
jgi:hypothetical protein